MFNGDERTTITTTVSEDDFEKKAQEAFEPLGEMDISGGGSFKIAPKTSLVSFLSTVTLTGKIKQTDDGFQINIQYVLAPSPLCWVAAIGLFCFTVVGAAVIIAPLVLDKPSLAKAIENAFRDLKDSVGAKKRSSKASSDD